MPWKCIWANGAGFGGAPERGEGDHRPRITLVMILIMVLCRNSTHTLMKINCTWKRQYWGRHFSLYPLAAAAEFAIYPCAVNINFCAKLTYRIIYVHYYIYIHNILWNTWSIYSETSSINMYSLCMKHHLMTPDYSRNLCKSYKCPPPKRGHKKDFIFNGIDLYIYRPLCLPLNSFIHRLWLILY